MQQMYWVTMDLGSTDIHLFLWVSRHGYTLLGSMLVIDWCLFHSPRPNHRFAAPCRVRLELVYSNLFQSIRYLAEMRSAVWHCRFSSPCRKSLTLPPFNLTSCSFPKQQISDTPIVRGLPLSGKGFIIGCQSPCRGGEKLLAVEGKLRDSEIERQGCSVERLQRNTEFILLVSRR